MTVSGQSDGHLRQFDDGIVRSIAEIPHIHAVDLVALVYDNNFGAALKAIDTLTVASKAFLA
jgi:hypothetical protein